MNVRSVWFKGIQCIAVLLIATFGATLHAQTGNVSITKTVLEASYIPGQSVTYTISVSNLTATPVNGLTITDVFPAEFAAYVYNVQTLINSTIVSGGSGQGNDLSGSPGTLTTVVNLGGLGAVQLVINAVVRVNFVGGPPAVPVDTDPLNNIANLVLPVGFTDTDLSNNSSTNSLAWSGEAGGSGVGFTLCANLAGKGPLSISTAGEVLNTFFTPSTTATVSTLTVGQRCLPTGGFAGVGATPTALSSLGAGQKLLVIQMQDGAAMTTTDDGSYGANIGNAGVYEYVEVRGAVGTEGCAANFIPIIGSSGVGSLGLANAYVHRPVPTATLAKRVTQYVRVPQYTDITISGSGTIVTRPWDGLRGGVTAADASGTFDLGTNAIPNDVAVEGTCAGFRGGGTLSQAVALLTDRGPAVYRRTIALGNGVKGEGLSGTPRLLYDGSGVVDLMGADGYVNGATGRGAPGSAGGGGNACTAVISGPPPEVETGGGGGGGNGGRGGSGGTCNSDAITGTGAADTGGVQGELFAGFTFNGVNNFINTERPTGVGRVTMGSGGGAGAGNGNTGVQGSGGLGGGIILLSANSFIGNRDIVANGCNGQAGGANGGGGGAGAGGTVVLLTNLSGATTYTGIQVRVQGGAGGNAGVGNGNADLRGPGGGGGSGRTYISRIANGGSASVTSSGGAAGATDFTPDISQSQSYNAAVGNNFVEQSNLNAYNSVPGAKPGFVCSETVPVTLSDVKATIENGEVVVRFGTASEAGTLGFRAYQNQPSAQEFALNRGNLTIGAGASSKPQRYEIRGANRGAQEVWIEEIETNGKSTVFGPYPINVQIGEREIATATDWAGINTEQRNYRNMEAQSISSSQRGAQTLVELKVASDGWYQVSHAQLLAANADFSGTANNQLRLMRGNRAIALEVGGSPVFGAGSTLGFYAESVKDSLYTDKAVYTLSAQSGTAQLGVFANPGALNTQNTHMHTVTFNPNRGYSFSSPTSDPWFATRIVRSSNNPGLAVETVSLTERVPSQTERMKLRLWGGTSYADVAVDHSLTVTVNGQLVATTSFDGVTEHGIDVALPQNVLTNGSNTVSVQLTPNGAAADVIYLESISFSYVRKLKVETDGQLSFAAATAGNASERLFTDNFNDEGQSACSPNEAGCAAYSVELTASDARVFKISNGSAQVLNATKRRNVGGTTTLEFAQVAGPGERFLVSQSPREPTMNLAPSDTDLLNGTAIDYLVITHPSFASELTPLVMARQSQGLNVKVVNVESLYRAYTSGELSPIAVSTYLQAAQQAWPQLKYVLLVGGDSYDYKNYLGNSSISFVPTQYRRTHEVVAYAPVDQIYADMNRDGRPDLAIGRLPVRTIQELRNVIDKTLAYNNPTTARKLVWANDRDSGVYPFAAKSDTFAGLFSNWTVQRVDLNAYATGQTGTARNELVAHINAGQALVGFYGHSSPSNWTRESLLTSAQVNQNGLFSNAQLPTGVVQFGCWGTYFVDPQYTSMSHAMLLNVGGAAAVIGASGLTEVGNDEAFASALLPRLNIATSFGEANQQSASAIRASNPGAIDVWLGSSLLGDPALRPNN